MDRGMPFLFCLTKGSKPVKEQSRRETGLDVALNVVSEDTGTVLEETLATKSSLLESATTERLGHLTNSQSADGVIF